MRLRHFTAPDMPCALALVREHLGEHAIILASEELAARGGVKVTAAVEEEEDEAPLPAFTPPPRAQAPAYTPQPAVDALRYGLQERLRFHNVPELFVAKILNAMNAQDVRGLIKLEQASDARQHLSLTVLSHALTRFFRFAPLDWSAAPARLMLIGQPGVGKTLTIAKLATRLAQDGRGLIVCTTDNKRAGGIEQLQVFTNILGVELHTTPDREQLLSVLRTLPAGAHVLVDTAGCNPYAPEDCRELASLASVAGIEPILVMTGGGDSLEAIDAVEAFRALPFTRMLITRADTTRRFGGALSVAAAHGLAFAQVSRSSSVVSALEPATPSLLAELITSYSLQKS